MIYLDNHATTRLDEAVLEAMRPALTGEGFGNPSSTHSVGVEASRLLEGARAAVASLLPGRGRQVVFTSGATEANSLALLGRAPKGRRRGVVISAMEHPSVLRPARELERRGCALKVIAPDRAGLIDAGEVVAAVDDETALVALMAVNNEVGTVQPAAEVAARVSAAHPRCHVHVDVVQAVGLVDLSGLEAASSLSLSAHKIHGPKGSGALIFDADRPPRPSLFGGGQEGGVRSGTQNVAGAVGLAAALERALSGWEERSSAVAARRDRLIEGVTSALESAILVGHPLRRSPANAMIGVQGLSGDVLVGALDQRGIIASTGAACHGSSTRPSEALQAMGIDSRSLGTVRFGLSGETTDAEIEQTIEAFVAIVRGLGGS